MTYIVTTYETPWVCINIEVHNLQREETTQHFKTRSVIFFNTKMTIWWIFHQISAACDLFRLILFCSSIWKVFFSFDKYLIINQIITFGSKFNLQSVMIQDFHGLSFLSTYRGGVCFVLVISLLVFVLYRRRIKNSYTDSQTGTYITIPHMDQHKNLIVYRMNM